MAILEIIQPDNPVLRKKAIKVTDSRFKDDSFQTLVDDMVETLKSANGVGLAAPQVEQSVRLIIVRLSDSSEEDREEYGELAGKTFIVANPKIIKSSREMVLGVEGCLSMPGLLGEVERHEMVVVTGQDRHGKDFRIKAKGWLARVFQHEIDHLNGQLFIDITDEIWRVGDELVDEDGDEITIEEA
ncbi:MAG: peptide deformylase [Phototrophicaceae bacterium]